MSSPYLGIAHIATNQTQKELTANAGFDGLDSALNAEATFAMADANFVLTQAHMASGLVLVFTGALSAARNVLVPAIARLFVVKNNTVDSGSPPGAAHNLTIKTSSGTGIAVAATDGYVLLYCDGTNVVALAALDSALNAEASFAMSDADLTLTQTQTASGLVLVFTGALSAARNVVVPAIARLFAVKNNTVDSGSPPGAAHNLTVKTASGTGIAIAAADGYVLLYCDGTNVVALAAAADPSAGLTLRGYTVANLPATPGEGAIAFATNGRKVGEGSGSGTGVPVYFSNTSWRVFATDAAVAA